MDKVENWFKQFQLYSKNDFERGIVSDTSMSPMYVYSKQVKDKNVKGEILNRKLDKERVSAVITSLKEIGKCKNLEEFELGDNCRQWVLEILSDFTNKEAAIKYLLTHLTQKA